MTTYGRSWHNDMLALFFKIAKLTNLSRLDAWNLSRLDASIQKPWYIWWWKKVKLKQISIQNSNILSRVKWNYAAQLMYSKYVSCHSKKKQKSFHWHLYETIKFSTLHMEFVLSEGIIKFDFFIISHFAYFDWFFFSRTTFTKLVLN